MKKQSWFSPIQKIIAGLILCLIVAAGAYVWATSAMGSMFAYRSPLKDSPPAPGQALGKPAARQVVFVLVDALRYDTTQKPDVMPTLAKLRQQGASATMHSRPISYSESGYSTLLVGAWPELHDGPAANLDYDEIPTWTQDNLFSAANRAGLKTAISGYYWFEKLVPQTAVNAHFYTPGEDQAADRQVVDAALPWLGQGYNLILVHIDQVDYAGHHEGGPQSVKWDDAARRADSLIAEIVAKLDLSKDTILVCSDHGQIDQGGHGGPEPVVLTEPFVLAGAAVKPGSYGDIHMVDVAPTLAALLGANLPASTQGQVRSEMLTLPADTLAALPNAINSQQTNLVKAYTQAIGQPIPAEKLPGGADVPAFQQALENAVRDRLYLDRVPRWLTLGLIVLLGIGILSRVNKRALAWSFGGALLALAIFFLRYAVLDKLPLSLSWVTGQMDLILYIATTTAAGMLAGWLLAMVGQRAFSRGRMAAAQASLGFILALLGLLCIPIGVNYAINGAMITWTLPDMYSIFLGILSLIGALAASILGILLTGLAALFAKTN